MMLRIKEILKQKNISVNELAKMLNITRVGVSKIINGTPNLQTLQKIANVLGVHITDLFEPDPNRFLTLYYKDESGNFIEWGKVSKEGGAV